MKIEKRNEARRMRLEQGCSIREIMQKLSVAKSTASLWVRDISLTDKQLEVLKDRQRCNGLNGAAAIRRQALVRHSRYQEEGFRLAKGNHAFRVLCALYWGEGNKTNPCSFIISNSDIGMLRLVLNWLIGNGYAARISFRLYYHQGNGVSCEAIVEHWRKQLGRLDPQWLRKSIVYRIPEHGNRGKNIGKMPYGTGVISVHDTRLQQMMMGGIRFLDSTARLAQR